LEPGEPAADDVAEFVPEEDGEGDGDEGEEPDGIDGGRAVSFEQPAGEAAEEEDGGGGEGGQEGVFCDIFPHGRCLHFSMSVPWPKLFVLQGFAQVIRTMVVCGFCSSFSSFVSL